MPEKDGFYKILSVDDEPIVHRMLEKIIKNCKLPVELVGTALSGADALAKIRELHPHICILDIHMEGMSGLELAEQLHALPDYRPHIIFLTAYDRFDYARQAIHFGAIEYILKPIGAEEVTTALSLAVQHLQNERIAQLEQDNLKKRLDSVAPSIKSVPLAGTERRVSSLAQSIRSFVEDHFSERISLESVAKHVNYSAGYTGEVLRKELGISFRGLLRLVRIAKAKELMKDQSLNLSDIAQAVGYDDVNYFSQAFLEETGVRPSEYRGGGRRWAK